MKQENKFSLWKFLFKIFQGAFVGLGAVLPGISGDVLCVIFGIYKTIMEFLADPFKKFKTHVPKLLPYGIGVIVGFLGIVVTTLTGGESLTAELHSFFVSVLQRKSRFMVCAEFDIFAALLNHGMQAVKKLFDSISGHRMTSFLFLLFSIAQHSSERKAE